MAFLFQLHQAEYRKELEELKIQVKILRMLILSAINNIQKCRRVLPWDIVSPQLMELPVEAKREAQRAADAHRATKRVFSLAHLYISVLVFVQIGSLCLSSKLLYYVLI
jgi:hypothetical protein